MVKVQESEIVLSNLKKNTLTFKKTSLLEFFLGLTFNV